jgi:hypothetical protein
MKTEFKWALIFGLITAVINFLFSFLMSLVCGVFTSPIAAGLATYFSSKEFPEQNQARYRVKIGLIVGSVGSLGGILGTITSILLLSLAFFTFNAQDRPSFEELSSAITSGYLLSSVVSIIVVSIVLLGLCIGIAAITGNVLSNRNSSPKNVT